MLLPGASTDKRSGKAFEIEVFKALEGALGDSRLGLNPRDSRVLLNPSYYSRARGKPITFDVSVEVRIPGATAPWLIWIWECKDYNSPVPVDDVEEFHAKLQQVGDDGAKGTMITRGTFQESAINYAASLKMGLARLLPEAQVEWLLYRPNSGTRKSAVELTNAALIEPDFGSINQALYGFTAEGRTMLGLSFERFVALSLAEWLSPA